jgi:hypothetical protein
MKFPRFQALAASFDHIREKSASCRHASPYGEMIYFHTRESKVQHALIVYDNGDIDVLYWMLKALGKNTEESAENSTLSLVYSYDNKELASLIDQFLQLNKIHKVQVRFRDVSLRVTSVKTKNQISRLQALHDVSYDVIYFNLVSHRKFLINAILEPQIARRSMKDAGLLVFYDTCNSRFIQMHNAHRSLKVNETNLIINGSFTKNKNSSGVLTPAVASANQTDSKPQQGQGQRVLEDELSVWLSHTGSMSIDVTQFGNHLDMINAERRKQRLVMSSSNNCSIALATIVPHPRVTIIVPASRPHLLPHILRSIRFNLVHEVIVVHAYISPARKPQLGHLRNPKIVELFNTKTPGKFGNPERNMGLASLPRSRVGWVYFLDDDNMMHQNMWMVMQTQAVRNVVLLGGEECPNYKGDRFRPPPSSCLVKAVDSSYTLFSAQLVRSRKWLVDRNFDAPFVAEACKVDPAQVAVFKLVAAYQNGIICDESFPAGALNTKQS